MNDESVKEGSFSKQLLAIVGVLVVIGMSIIGYVARVEDDAIQQRREMREEQHKANIGIARIGEEVRSAIIWGAEKHQARESEIDHMDVRIHRLEQERCKCED
jgi:hypothetical protein